jgi:two-component sensor histidine kinase
VVKDDGAGLPEGFSAGVDGLGTQIVQALVGGEMRGRITWTTPPEGGTEVAVEVTVHRVDSDDDPDSGQGASDGAGEGVPAGV